MAEQPTLRVPSLSEDFKNELMASNKAAIVRCQQQHTTLNSLLVQNRLYCQELIRNLDERIDSVRQLIQDGVDVQFLRDELLVLNSNRRKVEAMSHISVERQGAGQHAWHQPRVGRNLGRGGFAAGGNGRGSRGSRGGRRMDGDYRRWN